MAKKDTKKSKNKKAKNSKKGIVAAVVVIVLVLLCVGVITGLYFGDENVKVKLDDVWMKIVDLIGKADGGGQPSGDGNNPKPSGGDFSTILEDSNVSIHFLELGNKYTGDCTLIKCGDVEVLIDAGSRTTSSKAIKEYVSKYCTDGVLEYVIVTHAHQDHIAGFVGSKENPGVFESFECGTIIDFPLTNATSKVYRDYVTKRDAEVSAGAKHYTALECYREENGAKRTYTLGENVTLTILYNYYYENETDDENDYSVCVLLDNNGTYSLFTGDLEKDGEERLVKNNDLPKCKLFKGGHHGSYTASTDALLSVIQPEIVCVCCCCGSTEYTTNMANVFPSQAFISRVTKYTTNIYVTTLVTDYDSGKYESLNGNIVILFNAAGDVAVNCSNNNTKFVDTEWFKQHRKLE